MPRTFFIYLMACSTAVRRLFVRLLCGYRLYRLQYFINIVLVLSCYTNIVFRDDRDLQI